VNITTLCNVIPCIGVDKYLLEKTYSVSWGETLAPIYKITHRQISEDCNLKRSIHYMAQHSDTVEFQVQEIF
jgi:hypothetical protein